MQAASACAPGDPLLSMLPVVGEEEIEAGVGGQA
jgi:hypothetical protein